MCGAMVVLSLMPQLHLWYVRSGQWHGSYTVLQGDELLYSAYVNALIDGRPRQTDPPTGQDDHPQGPLPESLFSIQFLPAYAIAWPAKVAGVSTSTAFIVLLGVGGLLATLSVLWLLREITGDPRLAAVGVLFVLCLGAVAGGQGLVGLVLKPDVRFLGLPFLRRYEPAVAFPLFFVFCTLVWRSLTDSTLRRATFDAFFAGLALSSLIFSYFYLWTAAAAWFFCFICLWIYLRPGDRKQLIFVLITTSSPVILGLVLYTYLLSHLPATVDQAQVLTFTHKPDLFRIPELIGVFIILVLLRATWRGRTSFAEPLVIFAASCALTPFIVFNQQIITGRSLQPFHYEVLIANYVVLIGLVTIVRFVQPVIPRRTAVLIVSICLLWAAVEVNVPSPVRSVNDSIQDEMVPVLRHLNQLAYHDGTWDGLRNYGKAPILVFSPQYGVSRLLPTWAPQGLLLAVGNASFQSSPKAQRKEWLYMHLYYCGKKPEYVRQLLNDRDPDPFLTYFAKSTIFGPERILLFLSSKAQPVTANEIEAEVHAYAVFVESFSREQALKRPIGYVIVFANQQFEFYEIDRWYERDSGEMVGSYMLYRVKLR